MQEVTSSNLVFSTKATETEALQNIHLQGFMFSRVTRPNVDKRILPAAYSGYLASPKKQARRIRIQCVVLHNSTPTDISGGGGYSGYKQSASHPAFFVVSRYKESDSIPEP